ncbi:hypothetical protein [Syntrophobacter fumaroxidans]|uniref:hypothetical protein n=1 Tax=Syntrophobacter fumaroxidans TaxID=119484 RepID=UPI0012375A65|nr:hypothetical protein [Syntrophobacter fumaroxidans]
MNDELLAYGKGAEMLTDRQLMFLAMLVATLNEALRATVESSMAEIRDELAELRRATGGGR